MLDRIQDLADAFKKFQIKGVWPHEDHVVLPNPKPVVSKTLKFESRAKQQQIERKMRIITT